MKKYLFNRQPSRRGMGLVELLVALSISAALLAATGMAVDASFQSYAINQEQATLTQRARLAMHRIVTDIRTTAAHQPYTSAMVTNFAAGTTVTDTGISMISTTGSVLTARFDSTNKRLLMIDGGTSHVLLEGVQDFRVTMEPMRSDSAKKTGLMTYDLLMRATILLTVQTNNSTFASSESAGAIQTVTLSASVMPRRNVW